MIFFYFYAYLFSFESMDLQQVANISNLQQIKIIRKMRLAKENCSFSNSILHSLKACDQWAYLQASVQKGKYSQENDYKKLKTEKNCILIVKKATIDIFSSLSQLKLRHLPRCQQFLKEKLLDFMYILENS